MPRTLFKPSLAANHCSGGSRIFAGSNPSSFNCAISAAWLSDSIDSIAVTFTVRAARSSRSNSRASAFPDAAFAYAADSGSSFSSVTMIANAMTSSSLLHRSPGQPADELALQRQEEQRRWKNRDERAGKEYAVMLRVHAEILVQQN